jgi:hypothetical protein
MLTDAQILAAAEQARAHPHTVPGDTKLGERLMFDLEIRRLSPDFEFVPLETQEERQASQGTVGLLNLAFDLGIRRGMAS